MGHVMWILIAVCLIVLRGFFEGSVILTLTLFSLTSKLSSSIFTDYDQLLQFTTCSWPFEIQNEADLVNISVILMQLLFTGMPIAIIHVNVF